MSGCTRGQVLVDVGLSPARLAWGMFGLVTACLIVAMVLSVAVVTGPASIGAGDMASAWMLWLAMFTFPVVGVLVAARRPGNPIGWILLGIGLVWSPVIDVYAYYGLVSAPGSLPRPDLVAVVTSSWWVPGVGLIGTFLLLLFPDGRLPSRRWRPFAWLTALALLGLTVVMPLLPAPLNEIVADADLAVRLPDAANPLGVTALAPVLRRIFLLVALVPTCIAGSALSLIVRFRRSRGQERLQLKWLAAAGAVTAAIYVTMMVLSLLFGGELRDAQSTPRWLSGLQDVSVGAFVLIPLAIGVAILRHRLYEIDRIISRTATYAVLTVVLVGVYAAIAVVPAVVFDVRSDLLVAAATLTAAAVFQPLRRRVQTAVDRRFNRTRYDATRTAEAFTARLRGQTAVGALVGDLVDVVGTTVQPAVVSVWLRRG